MQFPCGDSDVFPSTIVTAAILEVYYYKLQQCNVANLYAHACKLVCPVHVQLYTSRNIRSANNFHIIRIFQLQLFVHTSNMAAWFYAQFIMLSSMTSVHLII